VIGASESWCMHHDAPSVLAGHYDPSFTLDLCQKDMNLIVQSCDDARTEAPTSHLVCDRFEMVKKKYGGNKGEFYDLKLEEDAAGVSIQRDGNWKLHWEK
jgi:3-hydroxyisobutyrate dehydrogenase